MSVSSQQIRYCVCGLPCSFGEDNCDSCLGKNSIHIEGYIVKKQKKGDIKKYWFVLLGKELYSYKKKGEQKHKDM